MSFLRTVACCAFHVLRLANQVMHLVHLGILRDVVGSALYETAQNGAMKEFLALEGPCSLDEQLFAFTAAAKEWARDRRLDLHIKALSLSALGVDSNKIAFPELTSRVKASRARNLLAFVTHFAVEVASTSQISTFSLICIS